MPSPQVLFLITSDPRISPRPAEAVRVAAGLGASRAVAVTVFLHGPAICALREDAEGLVEGQDLGRYWRLISEAGQPVLVPRHAPELGELGPTAVPLLEIGTDELAQLLGRSKYVVRF